MAEIQVFEDPWPRSRKDIALTEAAVLHLQVSNFFLKLLAHFPSDHEGRIRNEALVYTEWRYIVYIRFLQGVGLSPHEVPPPWDVALVWYCHLMSTFHFHCHLIDSRHLSYGLNFTQFPLIELSSLIKSGKWTNRKGQSEWDHFMKQNGYDLAYQLWAHTPWEEPPGGLSRLFRKSPASGPSKRLSKVSEKDSEERLINNPHNPLLRKCVPESPRTTHAGEFLAISTWSLKEYTAARSRPWPVCSQTARHEDRDERCNLAELTPWPTIQDTKTALYNQVAFWTTLSKAQTTQSDFISGLARIESDYIHFMSLFRHRILRHSQLDPHANGTDSSSLRIAPPTLEVDLLWHTHRLHPGSYLEYCARRSFRLVEAVPSPSEDYFRSVLGATRERWQMWLPDKPQFPAGVNSTEEWIAVYTPETAMAIAPAQLKTSMSLAVRGWHPWRRRRVPAGVKVRRSDDTSGGGGGGFDGPTGGDGGGCGGGDGGGG